MLLGGGLGSGTEPTDNVIVERFVSLSHLVEEWLARYLPSSHLGRRALGLAMCWMFLTASLYLLPGLRDSPASQSPRAAGHLLRSAALAACLTALPLGMLIWRDRRRQGG